MTKPIYSPITQEGLQVAEFNMDLILGLVKGEPDTFHSHVFEVQDKTYEVNLGAMRYHVFKRSRDCACCGIKTTRCSLDLNRQATKETGVETYSFNFYAEVGDPIGGKVHYILMTRDHVIPVSRGGSNKFDNCQTLCSNCNYIKDDTDWTLERIRRLLFPAYRSYKASVGLNKAKKYLEPYRSKIDGRLKKIEGIKKGLQIVTDERSIEMKLKIEQYQFEVDCLVRECERIELEGQVKGIWEEFQE